MAKKTTAAKKKTATKSKKKATTKAKKVATKSKAAKKTRANAAKTIESAAKKICTDAKNKNRPSLSFPLRSLSNVTYDPKIGSFIIGDRAAKRDLSYNTAKTFAQTVRMMAQSKYLIDTDDTCTKREVYYNSKAWGDAKFDEQPESDTVMDDMEAMLGVNREQLGFNPGSHGGSVVGPLTVIDKNPFTGKPIKINCAEQGTGAWSVPANVEHLQFKTKAKFILAIETAGMFDRLVNHAYWMKSNCILIEMQGVPTRACRRFIRRLADDAKLPVYVFTDGDPYGYSNIYRTLKVGSGNAAHLSEFFCVPQAQFLGVTPQDIVDYELPTHKLKDVDIKRAKDAIKNDPFFQHHKPWQKALKQMIKMGKRAEQQAFAAHDLNYVLDHYLPEKMKSKKKFLP